MHASDRNTTIQIRSSTRDRLYKQKFRVTYDEYINHLLDVIEELERQGGRRDREKGKMKAMASMTREWVRRNVKMKDGRITEIDLNGQ